MQHDIQPSRRFSLRRVLSQGAAALSLLAVTNATILVPASANVSSEMNQYFSDAGGAANVTGPSAFQGQSAGYYSLGNVWTRFPQKNIQPFNLQLPSARAGCGGIDLFAGSFSFINTAELVAMLKATANNAIGFAFKLAIDSISPQISKVMDDMAQKVQQMNQMNISSCETAQGLLKGIWPINDANRSVICEKVGNSQGLFSDWASTRQGCNNGDKRNETIAANNDPNVALQLVGEKHNFTWDILKKSPQFSGYDQEFKELIMTMVGTIVTQPSTDPKTSVKIDIIGPGQESVITALLDGTSSATPVKILKCGDPDLCVDVQTQTLTVSQAAAIRPRVKQMIQNISDAIRTDAAIGVNERSLLNLTSIPLYKILSVQAAAHFQLGGGEIDTLAEVASIDLLQSILQNMMDQFQSNKTSLVKADEHQAEMWRQQINDVRDQFGKREARITSKVNVTLQIIDRSVMLESTLQNTMSPGMSAALNFSRGLNSQGIVQ